MSDDFSVDNFAEFYAYAWLISSLILMYGFDKLLKCNCIALYLAAKVYICLNQNA